MALYKSIINLLLLFIRIIIHIIIIISEGVICRQPQNIFLMRDSDGRPCCAKIGDFGHSRLVPQHQRSVHPQATAGEHIMLMLR